MDTSEDHRCQHSPAPSCHPLTGRSSAEPFSNTTAKVIDAATMGHRSNREWGGRAGSSQNLQSLSPQSSGPLGGSGDRCSLLDCPTWAALQIPCCVFAYTYGYIVSLQKTEPRVSGGLLRSDSWLCPQGPHRCHYKAVAPAQY